MSICGEVPLALRMSWRSATLYVLTVDQIGQTDAAEEFMDLLTEVAPQMMGQAGIAGVTTPSPWQRVASTDSLTASIT